MRSFQLFFPLRRSIACALTLLLVSACDRPPPTGTGGGTEPPPVLDSAVDGRRVVLDSLFGARGAQFAAELAAQRARLEKQAQVWADSIMAAQQAPSMSATASRAAGLQSATRASLEGYRRTFSDLETFGSGDDEIAVAIYLESALTVEREQLVLEERWDERVAGVALVNGSPINHPQASYHLDERAEATLPFCPDPAGEVLAVYIGGHDLYSHSRSERLAGPDNYTEMQSHGATATAQGHVDDQAEMDKLDLAFDYTLVYRTGSRERTANARYARNGLKLADVPATLTASALTARGGDYTALMPIANTNTLYSPYAKMVRTGFTWARGLWRGGRCVEVLEPGGPVQPASPDTRMTLRPYVRHKLDDSRPAGPIQARATGGSLSPEGGLMPPPANFIYTTSSSGAGTVDFATVSKRGIGFGQVRFTPVEAGAMLEYTSSTRYKLQFTDALEEERVEIDLTGEQKLNSQLSLAPIEEEWPDGERVFGILARTEFAYSASGRASSRSSAMGGHKGDASMSLSGVGVSLNPSRAGDPEFDQVAPDRYQPTADTAGMLRLWSERTIWGVKHFYESQLLVSGIVPQMYKVSASESATCLGQASTRDAEYNNQSRRYTEKVTGECFQETGDHRRDLPFGFGAISVLRDRNHPVTGSALMFTGEYDPRTGVIEGEEALTITDCRVVNGHDPLDLLGSLSRYGKVWRSDTQLDGGGCLLQYTVRWRFFVPPLP